MAIKLKEIESAALKLREEGATKIRITILKMIDRPSRSGATNMVPQVVHMAEFEANPDLSQFEPNFLKSGKFAAHLARAACPKDALEEADQFRVESITER